MSLKFKILLLALLPLVLVTITITTVSMEQARGLSEEEIKTFKEHLLASKRSELKHYVSLALTSIDHIVNNEALNEQSAKEEIKRVLNALTFGDDGYFFVYDEHGVNLVHPKLHELVGKDLIDLQDRNGNYVIRNLLQRAEEGGGFHHYVWNKPSTGTDEEKLSYVVQLERWRWMLGTGLYIDDIAREVDKAHSQVNINVRNTFLSVLVILSGTVILVMLLAVAINVHEVRLANTRLQILAHKSVQFQVTERRRFARELHDGISQMLISVLYRMGAALSKLCRDDLSAEQDLERGHRILKDAISELRTISHDLRPSLLDDMGLAVALESLLQEFGERTAIETELNYQLSTARLPEDIEITFYRIVQEALANIDRHSQATRIKVRTWRGGSVIWLSIVDNGHGFDPAEVHGEGIGISNMRERAELLSGIFTIQSNAKTGTRIEVGLTPFETNG